MTQFLNVFGFNNEEKRIPLTSGHLSLANLQHSFPGGVGLQYKEGTDTVYTTIGFNKLYELFECPHGGWEGKKLHVIYDKRPESPYSNFQGPLPKLEEVAKYCFYIKKGELLVNAVAISSNFFATCRHGFKECKKSDVVTLYSKDSRTFEATVRYINEQLDFILLKSSSQINENGPPICRTIVPGQQIILFGFDSSGEFTSLGGFVHSVKHCFIYLEGDSNSYGPFLLGTVPISAGDSGAAIFDQHGLASLNLGHTRLPKDLLYKDAIQIASECVPKNYMVPATYLLSAKNKVEAEDSPPKKLTVDVYMEDQYVEMGGVHGSLF